MPNHSQFMIVTHAKSYAAGWLSEAACDLCKLLLWWYQGLRFWELALTGMIVERLIC